MSFRAGASPLGTAGNLLFRNPVLKKMEIVDQENLTLRNIGGEKISVALVAEQAVHPGYDWGLVTNTAP